MHGRLRALGLVVLVVCGLTLSSTGVGHLDTAGSATGEAAVMAGRVLAPARQLTPRPTGERLLSVVAVLAAVVLGTALRRGTDRPRALLRLGQAASTPAPSRAPPAPQNLAF
jgi:hypothetical protein